MSRRRRQPLGSLPSTSPRREPVRARRRSRATNPRRVFARVAESVPQRPLPSARIAAVGCPPTGAATAERRWSLPGASVRIVARRARDGRLVQLDGAESGPYYRSRINIIIGSSVAARWLWSMFRAWPSVCVLV